MSRYPLRILVLEDHSFQRTFAIRLLRQLGCHEVFGASDGTEALVILKEVGLVDIALCDIRMEGMDGLQFLQRVGAGNLVQSVIISSSLSADLHRAVQKIVSLVGLDFLGDVGKPLHADPLQMLLDHYVNSPLEAPVAANDLQQASESEVRQAVEEGQLQAWFQPKINLRTGMMYGAEVLARWHHPIRGMLLPSVFVPVMERCGLMDDLLYSQLHQGLSLQRQAKGYGHNINIAFNLLTSQLVQSDLTQN